MPDDALERTIRLAIANALFVAGVVALVAGPWLASQWWVLASCLIGGIVLFALAELIAPFPDPLKHAVRSNLAAFRRFR